MELSRRITKVLDEKRISEGLDFILAHLKEPTWPKNISTKSTQGRRVQVKSREEALAWYKAANYLDCTISAYPHHGNQHQRSLNSKYMIHLVMIYLDIANFRSRQALERALGKTLMNIRNIFGIEFNSSVLWKSTDLHNSIIRPEDMLSYFIDENDICKTCGHDHSCYNRKFETDPCNYQDVLPKLKQQNNNLSELFHIG